MSYHQESTINRLSNSWRRLCNDLLRILHSDLKYRIDRRKLIFRFLQERKDQDLSPQLGSQRESGAYHLLHRRKYRKPIFFLA
jgi:hypothetical protein